MPGRVDFEVTGGKQLSKLAADLAAAGGPSARGIRLQLLRRLKVVGLTMREAVRTNILAIPSKGEDPSGLRQAMAAASRSSVSIGRKAVRVRVQVDRKAMPAKQRTMPAAMNSETFRHPVFGTSTWVTQPGHPYFDQAVDPLLPEAQAQIYAAIDEATTALRKGTKHVFEP